MTTPSTTAPPTADRLHSQGLQQNVAIVADQLDHHAHDDETVMQQLSDAIHAKDRDAVFAIASRLVSGSPAVVEQAATVEDKWLTVEQVAEYANVCRMTVWRWRNEQGLKFTKIGNVVRIRRSELDRFLTKDMKG